MDLDSKCKMMIINWNFLEVIVKVRLIILLLGRLDTCFGIGAMGLCSLRGSNGCMEAFLRFRLV